MRDAIGQARPLIVVLLGLATHLGCSRSSGLGYSLDGGVPDADTGWIQVEALQNPKTEVDILFLIDDSGSMAPKQAALQQRFPDLLRVLDTYAAQGNKSSYHIGVVTSDLGAPGIGCGYNLGAKLQQRGLAKTNTAGCQGPVGANYINYDQRKGVNNLPSGQDLATTFNCMATVVDPNGTPDGHYGCGFESQLEAVYRALHDPIAENAGFLRPDAVLAVVFVTDEDDCSADPDSNLCSSNPAYGPLNSYRCAQSGIFCDGMLLPSLPQASFEHCAPASPAQGSELTDLQKYINFFTLPASKGGVKANPRDVVLAAITAPATPVGTESATGDSACGTGVSDCTNVRHSCVAADNPAFFGDPAVRLSYVVGKAKSNQITSICDTDYKAALEGIGHQIVAATTPGCFSSPIRGGLAKPDCVVEDIIESGGTIAYVTVPACDADHLLRPCWSAVTMDACPLVCNPSTGVYEQLSIAIDRGANNTTPPGTYAQISCATVPGATDSFASCGAP